MAPNGSSLHLQMELLPCRSGCGPRAGLLSAPPSGIAAASKRLWAKGRAQTSRPQKSTAQHTSGAEGGAGPVFFTVLLEKLIQTGLCLSTPSWAETWRKGHKQSTLANDRAGCREEPSWAAPGTKSYFTSSLAIWKEP